MKSLIKRTLANFEDIKRTRLFHSVQRFRERRIARVRPELTPYRTELETLVRDGIVIIPRFATREQASAILSELEGPLERVRTGTFEGRYQIAKERVYFRICDAEKVAPSSAFFYQSSLVSSVAKAFLSERAESTRREAELRCDVGRRADADFFHFDNWLATFKAFLYLTDVGPDNAPFAYLKGSQHPAQWRVWKEIEFSAAHHDGAFGHYMPWEVERIQERHHFEEFVAVGDAGTLILADFRGLHRGTMLRKDRRVLLNNCFHIVDWPLF